MSEERRQAGRLHPGRHERQGHAEIARPDHALVGRGSRPARACRASEVVCGRVELIATTDVRLGLAPRERRSFAVRFLDALDPGLRSELTALVSRRGAAARRAAERMAPIEIVYDDPLRGPQRITGRVQPPQRRNADLREIPFGLREAAAP